MITGLTNNGSLYFPNVKRLQIGTYAFQAQTTMRPTYGGDSTGQSNVSVNVDVLYKPIIGALNNVNIVEGLSLNITCVVVSANPDKTITRWTREKNDLNKITNTLILQNISRIDSMSYKCTVNNSMAHTVGPDEEGLSNETFYLNVWYRATVERFIVTGHANEHPIVANESTAIQFTCEIDSNPNSTVVLTLPNGTNFRFDGTNLIDFPYFLSSCYDNGVYICSGSNDYNNGQPGSANISLRVNSLTAAVLCKPIANGSIEADIRSKLYTRASLYFTAIAYPEPEFIWEMKTISSHITNNSLFSISNSGMNPILTINNFTSTEVDRFRLIIENYFGRLIQEYTLQGFAADVTAKRSENSIGLVAGSITVVVAIAVGIVFSIHLYRNRQTGKGDGNNESTRSHEGVSEMKTMAEEHISNTTERAYEDLKKNRDRGIIERMENTYEQLRREKDTTSEEVETDFEEIKEEKDDVGSPSPIYTNLKL